MKSAEAVRFKLPSPKGHSVRVVIHPTLADVRRISGIPTAWAVTEAFSVRSVAAVLHFSATNLNFYVVAHELVHVAFALRRRGCTAWEASAEGCPEEAIAYPVGELMQYLVEALNKRGYEIQNS